MTVKTTELMNYAKEFTGLTQTQEQLLAEIGPEVIPELNQVSDIFYTQLMTIDKARPFIINRLDSLKWTHQKWLETIFSGTYDESFTAWMYKVGDVHVKVKLPVEFVAGATTIINNALMPVLVERFSHQPERFIKICSAVNSILGFSLMIMQESYQQSSLAQELEKFLSITGMSRTLFDNLAKAYQD